jgi:hypothetical protein
MQKLASASLEGNVVCYGFEPSIVLAMWTASISYNEVNACASDIMMESAPLRWPSCHCHVKL